MSFNPDPSKQAQEIFFSRKSKRPTHPPLVFDKSNVSQTFSQKHLGVILDFKLTLKIASIIYYLKLTKQETSYANFEIYYQGQR